MHTFENASETKEVNARTALDELMEEITKPLDQRVLFSIGNVAGRPYSKNELSKRSREKRENIEKIHGLDVYFDHGAAFVKVPSGGSTSVIKQKLSRDPRFAYLKDMPSADISSFNYDNPRSIKAGKWIPIPHNKETRKLGEAFVKKEFEKGLHECLTDTSYPYQENVQRLVNAVGKDRVMRVMLSVADKEMNGEPFGQFSYHRIEPDGSYSLGIFQFLMRDGFSGVKAMNKIGFTEGQLYNLQNGVKVFFGYIVEQILGSEWTQGRTMASFFDDLNIEKNAIDFTSMYNGGHPEKKTFSQDYVDGLRKSWKKYGTSFEFDMKDTSSVNKKEDQKKGAKEIKKERQVEKDDFKYEYIVEEGVGTSSALLEYAKMIKERHGKGFFGPTGIKPFLLGKKLEEATQKALEDGEFQGAIPGVRPGDAVKLWIKNDRLYARLKRGRQAVVVSLPVKR